MKKLMIMAAVALTAAVVNAAASTWTIAGATTASVKNGDTVWSVAGTSPVAYLILASDITSVQTALDTDAAMDVSYSKASYSTFNSRGRFAGVEIDIPTTTAEYSMVLVYTDATDADKIWYQFSSATANASGSDDSMTPPIAASFGATTFSSTGWTSATATADVPEPTSGLLMLLGFAGLALRRKHD